MQIGLSLLVGLLLKKDLSRDLKDTVMISITHWHMTGIRVPLPLNGTWPAAHVGPPRRMSAPFTRHNPAHPTSSHQSDLKPLATGPHGHRYMIRPSWVSWYSGKYTAATQVYSGSKLFLRRLAAGSTARASPPYTAPPGAGVSDEAAALRCGCQ